MKDQKGEKGERVGTEERRKYGCEGWMKGGQRESAEKKEKCKSKGMDKDREAKCLGRQAIIQDIRHNKRQQEKHSKSKIVEKEMIVGCEGTAHNIMGRVRKVE